ncbi:alcohol dehydrogenase-like 7 isoform X2 [Lycium ferocissimum]|uniref:alcohol dehydrogenase-like 7 isoform X2 n=1 Tax=Lycium ferocissimum TaxID=112874 RepID=UPI0028154CBF|nr:alcohol dehydrogenase-like 7 isoform X2 [Lycium ferocissimum]
MCWSGNTGAGSIYLLQKVFTFLHLPLQGWGKTVVLGVDKPDAQLNFNSLEVLQSRKTLTGALFGGLKPKSDVPILAKRYLNKELQLDKFVTHEVNFEDINKAFDLLIQGKSLRCVIWMDK